MKGKTMKHNINAAIVYAVLAMAGGVFYREFTKFAGFDGRTALAFVHTHWFMLGMVFLLLLVLLEKAFAFETPATGRWLVVYHVGLNLSVIMLIVRGIAEVLGMPLSRGLDASISGVAGLGHILLAVGMIAILSQVAKAVKRV